MAKWAKVVDAGARPANSSATVIAGLAAESAGRPTIVIATQPPTAKGPTPAGRICGAASTNVIRPVVAKAIPAKVERDHGAA